MMASIHLIIGVLLFAGVRHICGNRFSAVNIISLFCHKNHFQSGDSGVKDIKGRLLTPEEGCGLSKVMNKRIIGGSEAPIGAWPWLAVLAYLRNGNRLAFECGKRILL